jgi:hypothetical protein
MKNCNQGEYGNGNSSDVFVGTVFPAGEFFNACSCIWTTATSGASVVGFGALLGAVSDTKGGALGGCHGRQISL